MLAQPLPSHVENVRSVVASKISPPANNVGLVYWTRSVTLISFIHIVIVLFRQMSFQDRTPESLVQRSDSKNPATTCKGITSSGRPCRRALATTKASLIGRRHSNDSAISGVVALICCQPCSVLRLRGVVSSLQEFLKGQAMIFLPLRIIELGPLIANPLWGNA